MRQLLKTAKIDQLSRLYCIMRKFKFSRKLWLLSSFFFLVIANSGCKEPVLQKPALQLKSNLLNQPLDYHLLQNWMCNPMKSTDISRQQPLALTVQKADLSTDHVIHYTHPVTNTGVDIFYVYPTIDTNMKAGNTAFANINTTLAKFIYSEQVGIYAQFGRVFVPYYKQANIGVFIDSSLSDCDQAHYMEIAYRDIEAAFDNYLKYYNKGNRIILIGHSQGAFLVRFLLRKRFDNNPSLRSKLIVAIAGGEANYSATNSRTGGSLQNIKTFPAVDSPLECGCLITWRTWKMGAAVELLEQNSFLFNKCFVDLGLIYQTYDTKNHVESIYNFGYKSSGQPKKLARYITLGADKVNYFGFDGMFSAQQTPSSNVPGSAYIRIENNNIPNDQRAIANFPQIPMLLQSIIPIPGNIYDYHIWDMQFAQGDLLQLIPKLIAKRR
jgi:Protein of unknown function (DUF3089)